MIRGNAGEPRIPEDPARGLVWSAIEDAVHTRLAWDRFQEGLAEFRREAESN
ncbi:hypothetical protein GCM10009578_093650 [Streptomyces rhizosphaericus]|uniref:hypothetical protein n=1 Tax=Streptomyces rhizosphaericus TaxID=114699 RepID=UPI001FD0CA6D|nr:hypothetical protein [Streptomyces rhizosphaericus]